MQGGRAALCQIAFATSSWWTVSEIWQRFFKFYEKLHPRNGHLWPVSKHFIITWPRTLTYITWPSKVNRRDRYLGQRSYCPKVIVPTQTHTTNRLLDAATIISGTMTGTLHWVNCSGVAGFISSLSSLICCSSYLIRRYSLSLLRNYM